MSGNQVDNTDENLSLNKNDSLQNSNTYSIYLSSGDLHLCEEQHKQYLKKDTHNSWAVKIREKYRIRSNIETDDLMIGECIPRFTVTNQSNGWTIVRPKRRELYGMPGLEGENYRQTAADGNKWGLID